MQTKTGCWLCNDWDLLARDKGTPRLAVACLGFVDLWEVLGKSIAQIKAGCCCGEATARGLGLSSGLGGMGSQKNHQSMENGVIQVNGKHRFGAYLCRAGWAKKELTKGKMVPASASIRGEKCPSPCSFRPHTDVSQFSSSMYVAGTLGAEALCWSLVWLSFDWVSLCTGPLIALCLGLTTLCLSHKRGLLVFHREVLWELLFLILYPGLVSLMWGWNTSSLGWTS